MESEKRMHPMNWSNRNISNRADVAIRTCGSSSGVSQMLKSKEENT